MPLVLPSDAALFSDFTTYVFSAWQPTVREALARILPRQVVASVERIVGVSLNRPPSALPFAAWVSLTPLTASPIRTFQPCRVPVSDLNGSSAICRRSIGREHPVHGARSEGGDVKLASNGRKP